MAPSRTCATLTTNDRKLILSMTLIRLAAMGISREVAERVLAAIRADAEASGTGKARTARVIAVLAAQDITATAPAIRILAGSLDIELERAAEPGKGGGGRPVGSRDRRPREGAHEKRLTIGRLRVEHPGWSEDEIGKEAAKELGLDKPMDRQLVNYHLDKLNLRRDKD